MDQDRLQHFTERLKEHPGILAHQLRLLTREQIAARLTIDQAAVTRLLLCRTPRPDRRDTDIDQIAGYVGTDAGALATLLRDARLVEYVLPFTRASLPRPKA